MKNFLLFFLTIILLFAVLATAQSTIIAPANKYIFLFNPLQSEMQFSVQGKIYEWTLDEQRFVTAQKMMPGKSYTYKPISDATLSLQGNLISEIPIPIIGYQLVGVPNNIDTQLKDLEIIDGSNKIPFVSGNNNYYGLIYEFDVDEQRFVKLTSILDNTILKFGKSYFIKILKPFTLKLKSTTAVTQVGACTTGQIKCAITQDSQYTQPTAETLAIEDKVQICQNGQFVDSKCDFGKACRIDSAGKSCCQETSPPPLIENGIVLAGARPVAALCPP